MGRKASAAAAAHAASKKAASALELSATQEANVRQALKTILKDGKPLLTPGKEGKVVTPEDIQTTYDNLLDAGFSPEQAKAALEACAGHSLATSTVLDWLCLNMPMQELPHRFAPSFHAQPEHANVKVVAQAPAAAETPRNQQQELELQSQAAQKRKEQAEAAKKLEAARQQQAKQDEAAAEKQRRAWIMQYVDQEPSSSSEDEQEAAAVDEWGAWGDEREVQRRKAERKRANLPLELRRSQVAQEWVAARREAANAKQVRDKDRQRVAGLRIRDLKQEMAEVGLTESDADNLVQPAATGPPDLSEQDFPALGAAASAPQSSKDLKDLGGSMPPGNAESKSAASEAFGDMSGSDNDELGLGVLDDNEESWGTSQESSQRVKPPAARPKQPVSRPRRAKGSDVKAPESARKAAKALLQQFCQAEGRPPPRFEKRPVGGSRLETAGAPACKS